MMYKGREWTVNPIRVSKNENYFAVFSSLKVVGNEKQWGSGRSQRLGNGLGPWRSRFIYNLNTQLLNKNHFSFCALFSKINKRLL